MARMIEPFLIRARAGRPGDWQVWIREDTGLPCEVCEEWTRKSLRMAPPEFLATVPWPKTPAAARRVVLALVEYLHTVKPKPPDPKGPTVGEYAALFRDVKTSPRAAEMLAQGRTYSPHTMRVYESMSKRHVESDKELCALKMGAVKPDDLKRYFGRLATSLGGPCRAHQQVWTFLRMVFTQYETDTPGFVSPFRYLKIPVYPKAPRDALDGAEVLSIFETPGVFTSALERAVCAAAFWAGLRRSEIFALRWEHVDFDRRVIHIREAWKSFGHHDPEIGLPKWGKLRDVPLPEVLAEALRELKKETGDHDLIFVTAKGKIPGTAWWNKCIHGAIERAGIKTAGRKIEPHSARHSLASILESKGVPQGYIGRVLGHTTTETTQGYLHMATGEIDKMTEKLDGKGESK